MKRSKLRALRAAIRFALVEAPRAGFVFACEWVNYRAYRWLVRSAPAQTPCRECGSNEKHRKWRDSLVFALALLVSTSANAADWVRQVPTSVKSLAVVEASDRVVVGYGATVAGYRLSTGEEAWSASVDSASGVPTVEAVVSDGSAVYVAGTFVGGASVFGVPMTAIVGTDVFVAKFAPADGGVRWVRVFGASGADTTPRLAVDAGDLFLTYGLPFGTFRAMFEVLGTGDGLRNAIGTTISRDHDFTVVALVARGDAVAVVTNEDAVVAGKLWDVCVALRAQSFGSPRCFGGGGYDVAEAAVSVGDAMEVVGTFGFGGTGPLGTVSRGASDAMVLSVPWDPSAVTTVASYGGPFDDALHAVAAHPSGIVAGGQFDGIADFGGAEPLVDVHMAMNGALLAGPGAWSYGFGAIAKDGVLAVGSLANGDVVAGGFVTQRATFGTATLDTGGSLRGFVARMAQPLARTTATATFRPASTATPTSVAPTLTVRPTATRTPLPKCTPTAAPECVP